MGQALYRKYRPKSLRDVVGQEHVTKTLAQALKNGRISHAYLFTGPHGVGKTSIARILAHEVNKLPYDEDTNHLDIIEIDAASNRRIDEIRDLRDKVYIAPTSAAYKVYIIDEVHMLTREAFNALLKTLEEPPAHVIFILATTDAHKLPETIVSRTQRFAFKPVEGSKVSAHLRQIADAEKINISDEALGLLAKHGGGSFRDSISLLDQASGRPQKLETSDVLALLGIPPDDSLAQLLNTLAQGSTPGVLLQQLTQLFEQGYQASTIAKQLGLILRGQLVNGQPLLTMPQALDLLKELIEIPAAHDPERLLEVTLLKAGKLIVTTPAVAVIATVPQPAKPEESTPKAMPAKAASDELPATIITPPAAPKPAADTAAAASKAKADTTPPATTPKVTPSTPSPDNPNLWPEILSALKRKHNTLYGVARMAQAEVTPEGTLRLAFSFAFHQKRLNEAKNRQMLTAVIEQVAGHDMEVECIVDKNAVPLHATTTSTPAVTTTPAETSTDLLAISNIFGGGELLES